MAINKLLLFGATGDLAGRFIFPALAELCAMGRLPEDFSVVGASSDEVDEEAFRRAVARKLAVHANTVPEVARQRLVRSLRYMTVDLAHEASVARLVDGSDDRPVAVYLALPPAVFVTAVTTIAGVGLPAGSRIVVEKPFGNHLDAALSLNALLADMAGIEGEQAVFRVDHVLGMASVHNMQSTRFANGIFEPLWNSTHIEQIEILWEETLALEGRAGYYDRAGALADVIQNHLLQILCLVAMEPPSSSSAADLHDRKVDVLRAIRPFTPEDIVRRTRRARYTAGTLVSESGDELTIPAYVDEEGVERRRGTETFAELVIEVAQPRWEGTRFVLRAGKALSRRRKCVIVRFRATPHPTFHYGAEAPRNELVIGIDGPEGFSVHLAGGAVGPPPHLVPFTLRGQLPLDQLSAYSNVLLQVLEGGTDLSVRGDEAELAWRIVTPVARAWADDLVPLLDYPAGSNGPVEDAGRGIR